MKLGALNSNFKRKSLLLPLLCLGSFIAALISSTAGAQSTPEAPPSSPDLLLDSPAEESLPPSPPPAESVSASSTESSDSGSNPNVSNEELARNLKIPAYQRTRPQWGIEIAGSLQALGGKPDIPGRLNTSVKAVSLQLEYQPRIFQKIGILSAGPSASIYPTDPSVGITQNVLGIWSVGGQVRYQARFFREQPVVPMGGFEAQYFKYRINNGPSGSFTAKGGFVGGMFLLNILDTSAATEMYVENEISRTYLLAELRFLSGHDENIAFSGQSLFFGLRFEF